MREIYGSLRLANPFGHPSQVRTQVLLLQTCVDLRRLASPFGQGLRRVSRRDKINVDYKQIIPPKPISYQ